MHKFQASKWFIMCSLNAYYDNKRKTLKYILYSFHFLVFLVLVVELFMVVWISRREWKTFC